MTNPDECRAEFDALRAVVRELAADWATDHSPGEDNETRDALIFCAQHLRDILATSGNGGAG